jgi:hypothetical protein
MQLYGFNKLAANTTAATDGTPQSAGVALTASTNTLTLSQYIDYVTYSDKLILTGISPIVAEGSRLLGYRGALTVTPSFPRLLTPSRAPTRQQN